MAKTTVEIESDKENQTALALIIQALRTADEDTRLRLLKCAMHFYGFSDALR